MYRLLRPALFALPPETAHHLALCALRAGLIRRAASTSPCLQTDAFGLRFAHPLGLAAGFDKNAQVCAAILKAGFAFTEAGTVTLKPQRGNARPRVFRLTRDAALINRLGFNNAGVEVYCHNLGRARARSNGIIGANIGKNKDAVDAVSEYTQLLLRVAPLADYVTINISSPNTPGLRGLQEKDALAPLLAALVAARATLAKRIPILLKIAPDMDDAQAEAVAQQALEYGIDGLIISNTTIHRADHLKSPHAAQAGGLSGAPLFTRSTELLKTLYRITQGHLTLVGVGGVGSAEQAYAKIRAGATLVQLYTSMVYQGPGVVEAITHQLPDLLARDGFTHIHQAIGVDAHI